MRDNSLKYKIIFNDLRNKIITGYYGINQQLPLEKELGDLYCASRITVKKAMDLLVNDGLIIKRRGVGSFVKGAASLAASAPAATKPFGFTAAHQDDAVSSKLIEFCVAHPRPETIKNLYIKETDFVYHFSRVRYINKQPWCIEYTEIPIKIIPGIRIDNLMDSIYQHIEVETHFRIQSQHQVIRACRANPLEVENLEIDIVDPIMEIEQVAYLDNGLPFEYSIIHYRHDRYELQNVNINS